jgi:hypothetical protein
MSSVRESFVEHFGEDQARAIEAACAEHKAESIHSKDDEGNDPFKYAVLMCIGYGCIKYGKSHGITVSPADFKSWCLEHGDLASYKGPIPDYISFFGGVYNEYLHYREAQ